MLSSEINAPARSGLEATWNRTRNAALEALISALWTVALWSIGIYVGALLWAEGRFKRLRKFDGGPVIVGSWIALMVVAMVGWSAAIIWMSYRAILALVS
jgi:hypothetical protein